MTVTAQTRPSPARAGLASSEGAHDCQGYATTALNAGTAIFQTSTADVVAPPAAAGDVPKILGVIAYDPTVTPASTGEDFPAYTPLPIVGDGSIWVRTENALTVGANPFCRYANGAGGTVKGVFRTDADTATAAVVSDAIVLEVSGTTLARIKINAP